MRTIGHARRIVRSAGLGVLRHLPRVRLVVRRRYWAHEGRKYDSLAGRTPVDERLVFFESFGGRSLSCSPRAIYLSMLGQQRFSDYRFVWSFKGARRMAEHEGHPLLADARTTVVQRGSEEYFRALASAKVLVLNTRLPEYVTPKPDQVFVQCWHGTPLKRLGYDVQIETTNALNTTSELAERFGMDARKWSYLLSPSPYTSRHLADAFGLPEERRADVVIEEGYPRNDELALAAADPSASRQCELRDRLGVPAGKRALLYAPTWRDDSYKAGVGYTFDYLIDFDLMRRELSDDWVVLFRPHYYIANHFDFSAYEGFVIDVSAWDNVNELYIAADALVTDYSSVMFDYSILRRPIMLYVPDYQSYANDIRGFYFDLSEVPGPHVTRTEELVDALGDTEAYWNAYGEKYDDFVERFCPKDDGHAAERVIDRVWGPDVVVR